MTVATVKTVATRFLKSDKPEVLALKGAWGVGKTYTWNKLVLECRDEIKLPNYCYVSLFGISSIVELRTAIFTKMQSVKLLGKKLNAETTNREWLRIGSEKAKQLFRNFSKLINQVPYGKNITVGLETLAPYFIRETIVCLDDFERLATGAGAIKTEEILGLISELKEEKGCKVVLIFNEEQLNNKEAYSKYREKVVDIELLYDPTPDEASEIALPTSLSCRDLVKKHCTMLKVKNIRVLRKIVELIELMHPTAGQLHPRVMEQFVKTLVLLAWCYFDADDKKPTLKFLKEWNCIEWGSKRHKNEQIHPQHSAWITLLRIYDLSRLDEFDLAILSVIEHGYLEETGFEKEAVALGEKFKAQELQNSFYAAWELFHNTFEDNHVELVSSMCDSFKKSVKYISPVDLNSTTSLFRELGREDLANELINFYLDGRDDEDNILDIENYPFSSDISDSVIREQFKIRRDEKTVSIPLAEAVSYIADHNGWSNRHLQSLHEATVDDYYNLFKQGHDYRLWQIISCCLQFETLQETLQPIGARARAALNRIGKENPLNAIRMKVHKIVIDPEEPPEAEVIIEAGAKN